MRNTDPPSKYKNLFSSAEEWHLMAETLGACIPALRGQHSQISSSAWVVCGLAYVPWEWADTLSGEPGQGILHPLRRRCWIDNMVVHKTLFERMAQELFHSFDRHL